MKTITIERAYHARDVGFDAAMDAQHQAENIARSKGDLLEASRCRKRRDDMITRRKRRQEKRDPIRTFKDERLWEVADILRWEAEREELARAPMRTLETEEEDTPMTGLISAGRDPINRWTKAPRVYVSGKGGKAIKRESPPVWKPRYPKRQRALPGQPTVCEASVSPKFRAMDAFDAAFEGVSERETCRDVVLYRKSLGSACEALWGGRSGARVAKVRSMVEQALRATDIALRKKGY